MVIRSLKIYPFLFFALLLLCPTLLLYCDKENSSDINPCIKNSCPEQCMYAMGSPPTIFFLPEFSIFNRSLFRAIAMENATIIPDKNQKKLKIKAERVFEYEYYWLRPKSQYINLEATVKFGNVESFPFDYFSTLTEGKFFIAMIKTAVPYMPDFPNYIQKFITNYRFYILYEPIYKIEEYYEDELIYTLISPREWKDSSNLVFALESGLCFQLGPLEWSNFVIGDIEIRGTDSGCPFLPVQPEERMWIFADTCCLTADSGECECIDIYNPLICSCPDLSGIRTSPILARKEEDLKVTVKNLKVKVRIGEESAVLWPGEVTHIGNFKIGVIKSANYIFDPGFRCQKGEVDCSDVFDQCYMSFYIAREKK